MLVADSSQTILSTLIQVFEANHGVKSALENSLWDAHYFRVFVLDEWEARSYAIIFSHTLVVLQIQVTLTNVHWLWWVQDANKVRGTMYGHSSHTYIWTV
jgi:hypothetical protein